MRTNRIQSDTKNLLFDCLLHQLIRLLLRSLASGSLAPQQLERLPRVNLIAL